VTPPPVLLAGLGNDWRCDDGAGPWIARELGRAGRAGVAVLAPAGDGLALVEAWSGVGHAYVFDALRGAGRPGDILRIDGLRQALPQEAKFSSHAVGLADAVALGRSLDRLPQQLTVIGIEGACFDHGHGLSPAVAASARRVVEELNLELDGAAHA